MNKKGFTLIELLVVIAIIGMLSTLAVVALNSARAKSRDARRVADIKQIQTALEMYYNTVGSYPATYAAPFSGKQIATGTEIFLEKVPTAPTPYDSAACNGANDYVYTASGTFPNVTSYTLTFCLGAATGQISAGRATATPAGIK